MSENLPFSSHIETVNVGELALQLRLIDDLDDAIEYYAETAPEDADLIPYYTMLWDSAKALAEHMAEAGDFWAGKEVLELGCGLGVPSLVAARLGARVTATDYHPHNEPYFRENVQMNNLQSSVRYVRADWRRPALRGPFDVILGSDLIYEEQMVGPLADCVQRLCASHGTFMFADPGREHLQKAVSALEEAGFTHDFESYGDIYVFEFVRKT